MSDAQYSVEVAKSGKSKCKRCKTPIEKGTLRMATSVQAEAGYNATSYMHPACFNLPRKYTTGANKMTPQDFVRQVVQDASDSGRDILPAKTEELAAAIATTSIKKKKTSIGNDDEDNGGDGMSPKAWIASIKAAFEKLEDGGSEPASKKAKAVAAAADSSKREVITQAHIDAYASYKGCKVDELKDLLRWNNQILVGTKDVILTKVIDGTVHGRLGRCQMCNGGKLKFNVDNAHEILCNGEFDEATQRKISCPYTTTPSKAPRFQPWYTTEPSEEEKEAMENLIEQAKGGGGGGMVGTSDDPNVDVLVTAVKAMVGDKDDAWNLKSTKGMRSASIMVAKILLDHHPANNSNDGGGFKTIDLPRDDADKDYKNAKLKVAEVVQMNREKTIEEMIPLLIETFGYVEDKKKKASLKEDKLAETVSVPANAPIVAALQELGELYFKEGNRNAGGSYVKAVKALSELEYVITAENAKQLAKGKTKVPGIGKGTADKIFEFCTTGEIAKLQEKRADAA